jgi:hypothetical protein
MEGIVGIALDPRSRHQVAMNDVLCFLAIMSDMVVPLVQSTGIAEQRLR